MGLFDLSSRLLGLKQPPQEISVAGKLYCDDRLVYRDAHATVEGTSRAHQHQLCISRGPDDAATAPRVPSRGASPRRADEFEDQLEGDDERLFHIAEAMNISTTATNGVIWEADGQSWRFQPHRGEAQNCGLLVDLVGRCLYEGAHNETPPDEPTLNAYLEALFSRRQKTSHAGTSPPARSKPPAMAVKTEPTPRNASPTTSPEKLSDLVSETTARMQRLMEDRASRSRSPSPSQRPADSPRGPSPKMLAQFQARCQLGFAEKELARSTKPPVTTHVADLYMNNLETDQYELLFARARVDLCSDQGAEWIAVWRPMPAHATPKLKDLLTLQKITANMAGSYDINQRQFFWQETDTEGRVMVAWQLLFPPAEDMRHFVGIFFQLRWQACHDDVPYPVERNERAYLEGADEVRPPAQTTKKSVRFDSTDDVPLRSDSGPTRPDSASDADSDSESESESESEDEGDRRMRSTIRYKPTVFDGAKGGSATSNSLLAVGKDRSFVVQGSKIGVFRYDDDEGLRHTATINQVNDPNAPSERFSPKKVMLHRNDREMLLLRPGDDTHVYRMDLEAGKVVDSWEVQNARVKSILPDKKYAQMTDTSTITAFSDNALFQIDPRTADKTVNLKSYAVKNGFTSAATTGKGYVAVASEKGEIRLYNKLGMNAKTLLPGFGAPITGLDVTEDGQWVLATTRTYILLIPTGIEGSAKNGFETSMKQTPPQAIKLQLDPCHAVWMRCPINYTPARFNTGEQEERYIATSTGPWVIRWNFNRVKSGHTMNYIITRTKESVVDDSFRFNRARQIVVATKANVSAMHTSLMKRPEQLRADTVKEYDN